MPYQPDRPNCPPQHDTNELLNAMRRGEEVKITNRTGSEYLYWMDGDTIRVARDVAGPLVATERVTHVRFAAEAADAFKEVTIVDGGAAAKVIEEAEEVN